MAVTQNQETGKTVPLWSPVAQGESQNSYSATLQNAILVVMTRDCAESENLQKFVEGTDEMALLSVF